MEFRVVNETGQRLEKVQWLKIFRVVQRAQKAWPKTSVALIFTTPEKIKKLNTKYRKKSKVTDVLSFSTGKANPKDGSGDILVCPRVLKKQFPKKDLKPLLVHRFIHGLLHLHGYDHLNDRQARQMEKKTQSLIKKLSIW
jgi:probable rRNA maturation factor